MVHRRDRRRDELAQGVFGGLADDATKTFGGIRDALAAGDIALAAKVLWAMLKLEWQKGLAFLEGLWEGFKGYWNDAVIGLAMIFTNATAKIKTLWAELIGWMEKKWNCLQDQRLSPRRWRVGFRTDLCEAPGRQTLRRYTKKPCRSNFAPAPDGPAAKGCRY